MILPIVGLLGVLSVFAVIFICIKWLVRKQWYYILFVLCAHTALGNLYRKGWIQWEALGERLLLVMTIVCSVLILIRLLSVLGGKQKKRTA
ncbi:hypothetical protein [Terribacillus saccharophilus]|uniref:hypothetical protein n=1 Tax=Terribacillus saccharophilus TaxID=361277 RepID=UPI003982B1E9